MIPTVYETEPTGVNGAMEANGTAYHFCSFACRDRWLGGESRPAVPFTVGNDTPAELIDDETCTECGGPIRNVPNELRIFLFNPICTNEKGKFPLP